MVDTLHHSSRSGTARSGAPKTPPNKDDRRDRWKGPETLPFPATAPVAYFSSSAKLDPVQGPKILTLAHGLYRLGWAITGTDGTALWLAQQGVTAYGTSALYGFAKVLGGRVSSLLPQIWGGVLATPAMQEELDTLHWLRPQLVYGDFYAFEQAISDPALDDRARIDKIDVGGPSFIHAVCKGFCDPDDEGRIVVVDPDDCERALNLAGAEPSWRASEGREALRTLRVKAERTVATYMGVVAQWHGRREDGKPSDTIAIVGERVCDLAYGENRLQSPASVYKVADDDPLAFHRAEQIAGDPPGMINVTDFARAIRTMRYVAATLAHNFGRVPCLTNIVKHGGSSGFSVSETPNVSMEMAINGGPEAAMGACIATNYVVDAQSANIMRHHRWHGQKPRPVDVVIAPEITPEAVEILTRANGRCRMFVNPALGKYDMLRTLSARPMSIQIGDDIIVQPARTYVLTLPPFEELPEIRRDYTRWDMAIGYAIASTQDSNTVLAVKNGTLIGNGRGQSSRVMAARLMLMYVQDAGLSAEDAVVVSDSFFPQVDGPQLLCQARVGAVFATSGSIKDEAVRQTFADAGVFFYTVPDVEARGFDGHHG